MIPYPPKSAEKLSRTTYLKLKIQKRNFEKRASKLFVKLYFEWLPSLSYSSHEWISTESSLFMYGIQNFRCFSSKIQRKLKIKIFDPNLHFWVFFKILFLAKWTLFPNRLIFTNAYEIG